MNNQSELRDIVKDYHCEACKLHDDGAIEPILKRLEAYITADRKRVALEARIDEAKNARKMTTGCDSREFADRLVARIAELKKAKGEK